MQGVWNPTLVALSLLIAALASYVAIEFAGRMFERREHWWRWLAGGALAMGSGIWAMHFVGMAALSLPIQLSFDLGITLFSWVAAVAVSALALAIIGRGELNAGKVLLGALAMGAGICAMHYSGMGAMRLSPGIGYDPFWFAVSVLIAVGASAAALVIVAALRVVRSWRDVGMRVGAALVMGLAVAGMHYSGMAAAEFDPNAFCASGNALGGDWMAMPTVAASLLGLGLAILFTVADARAVLSARREARELESRVASLAFTDRETGLANRPRLSQRVVEQLALGRPFCLFSVRAERVGSGALPMRELAQALIEATPHEVELARTSTDQLMLLVPDTHAQAALARVGSAWPTVADRFARRGIRLRFGQAEAPRDGGTAQMLMFRAASRGIEIGARDASGELPLAV